MKSSQTTKTVITNERHGWQRVLVLNKKNGCVHRGWRKGVRGRRVEFVGRGHCQVYPEFFDPETYQIIDAEYERSRLGPIVGWLHHCGHCWPRYTNYRTREPISSSNTGSNEENGQDAFRELIAV